jgi:hypothetical protein
MRSQKVGLICLAAVAVLAAGCGVKLTPPKGVITITSILSPGTVNVPYSGGFTATGGMAPYVWTLTSGSLPNGLTLGSAGALSGIPTVAGTSTVTVQVADSSLVPIKAALATDITINDSTVSISTASPLPQAALNVQYTATLLATGGTPPYTWSLTSGSLPAGVTLSRAGVISGTPGASGSNSFTVQAADSALTPQMATAPLVLQVSGGTVAVTTASLPQATEGAAYSSQLSATGGVPPYSWSVARGNLPAGMTLSSAGLISGTPAVPGSSAFTIRVTDSGSTPQTATAPLALQVSGGTLAITTSSLSQATEGTAYNSHRAVTGGVPPVTWSVAGGTLPAGLTLSATGLISGTPTVSGSTAFTVRASDSAAIPQTATAPLVLEVSGGTLAITTASLSQATEGAGYSSTLAATGGVPPYHWSVAGGTLPAGVTLSSAGVISGTPAASGSSSFTVQATDSASTPQTARAPLALQVSGGTLVITTVSLPSGNAGTPYMVQLAAGGGVPPYAWSLTAGGLPAGIVLSTAGLLSGTPGSASSTSANLTVKDSGGHSASSTLSLIIGAATGTVPDNNYSFVFAGTAPQGTPAAQNGVAINGTIKMRAGQVLSGYYDENFNTVAPVLKSPITGGSLALGANGLGQLVLTSAAGTMTFALASPASVSTGGSTPIRMIEYDDATGSVSRGSGVIDPAPANPITAAISGSFAFLLSGTDIDQNQQALVGSFQTDGGGNITNGTADANQVGPVNGVPTRQLGSFSPLGGSYSVDADGRGLLTLAILGEPFHFSFYEVSPQEWLVISLDPANLNSPLVSGIAYQQTGAPFSAASLPAVSVLEVSGVVFASPPMPDISVGLAASDGNGNITYTFDEYNGSFASGSSTVPYSVDATTGRTTATAGPETQPILYIINSTSAFYLGVDQSGQSGMIEAQTGAPFDIASFSGDYLGGSLPLVLTSVLNESGLITADASGNVNFTTYRSSTAGSVYQNDIVIGTYTIDSGGRGVITAPDGITRIFYLVSPAKFAYLTSDNGGYLGIFQQ